MRYITYIVHHWRDDLNGEDAKFLGVFDSHQSIERGLITLKSKPGFVKYPDSFHITEFLIDITHWEKGYEDSSCFPKTLVSDIIESKDLPISNSSTKEVFLLTHFYETEIEDEDEVRYIGVYSSIENASFAIESLKMKPGFIEHPNEFNCERFELNKLEWGEGFVSWEEAM